MNTIASPGKKRRLAQILVLLCSCALALVLAACDSSSSSSAAKPEPDKTITSSILQGSPITIGITTSGGLDIAQQGVNFDVLKDGHVVAHAYLLVKSDYDTYASDAPNENNYATSTVNGCDVITYDDGSTYEALITIPDASTYIHILDMESQDSLNEVLSALTFSAG